MRYLLALMVSMAVAGGHQDSFYQKDASKFFGILANDARNPSLKDFHYFFGEGSELDILQAQNICSQKKMSSFLSKYKCDVISYCYQKNDDNISLVMKSIKKILRNSTSNWKIQNVMEDDKKNNENIIRFLHISVTADSNKLIFSRPVDDEYLDQFGHFSLVSLNGIDLMSSLKSSDVEIVSNSRMEDCLKRESMPDAFSK